MTPLLKRTFVLSLMITAACHPQAPISPAQYATMAPLDRYLITDSKAEMALARSAAPPSLSRDATILILGPHGYTTAITGINGFTCLVERAWVSPFDSHEFWNPMLRGPICYNPAAVQTILPYTINRTKLVLAGLTKDQMKARILAQVAKHELPVPAPGAMSYMMSKDGYLSDDGKNWCPHLMFSVPTAAASFWGANLDGSPVVFNNGAIDMPEGESIFMIPVSHWSDGSAAPSDMM